MRFVIIASARTGSNFLITQLSSHPDIFCHGDIFHPNQPFLRWPGWPDERPPAEVNEFKRLKNLPPRDLLERMYRLGFGRPHVGFKIFNGQNNEILSQLIRDPEVKKIVLWRNNVLARYASALAARQTGNYGLLKMSQIQDRVLVQFRPQTFRNHHDNYVAFYDRVLNELSVCGEPYWLLRYDELNCHPLLDGLAVFIGAEAGKMSRLAIKAVRGPADVLARFSNPDEVADYLAKNGLQHWAHEGDVSLSPLAVSEESIRSAE